MAIDIIEPASVQETVHAVAYFVTLHHCFGVDEEGFLTCGTERITIKDGEHNLPVALYQDPMPSAEAIGSYWVMNPFVTKAQPSPAMRLWYRSERTYIACMVIDLIKLVVMAVLTDKKSKLKSSKFSETILNPATRNLVAMLTEDGKSIADEIDEKTFSEVLNLYEDKVINEFVQRLYINSRLSTHINIPFLNNPTWLSEEFDISLRKKTISVIRAIILHVFDVENGKELSETYIAERGDGEPANFASGMRLMSAIHLQLNPYFEEVADLNVVDVDTLEEMVGNIKHFTARAKLMVADKITSQASKIQRQQKQQQMINPQAQHIQPQQMAAPAPMANPYQQQPVAPAVAQPQMPQPNMGYPLAPAPMPPQMNFPQVNMPNNMQPQMQQPMGMMPQPMGMVPQMQQPVMNNQAAYGRTGSIVDLLPPSSAQVGQAYANVGMQNNGMFPNQAAFPNTGMNYPGANFGGTFGNYVAGSPFMRS